MVERQYEEILTIVNDLIRYGASYTEAWSMDFRMYRHYINAKRDAIQDDLNNDRMLYTEQVALISRVLARKKFGQLKNIKFTKLDVLNARRRRDKKKNEAKHARQKVAAWAAFIHSYHVKDTEEENADGSKK